MKSSCFSAAAAKSSCVSAGAAKSHFFGAAKSFSLPWALPLLFPLAAMGCATPTAPRSLVDARAAYRAAEVDATRAAPTELHEARVALDVAEAKFTAKPTGTAVNDRAYIAERRSELAAAQAAIFIAVERRDASNVRLQSAGAAAARDLKSTRAELSTAEAEASSSARDVSGLKSDLKASESKATGLSSALATSKSDLRSSQTAADGLQTQLDVERQARKDAETRLTSTLLAMQDLKSVKEEPRGLVITLSGAVLFASGQSLLLPAAKSALNNVVDALKGSPDRRIVIEGHTDSQGTRASNVELSQRRGDSVRLYLITRGVAADRIAATGFGPDRPLADNTTTEGRANNRRVEIVLAPLPEVR